MERMLSLFRLVGLPPLASTWKETFGRCSEGLYMFGTRQGGELYKSRSLGCFPHSQANDKTLRRSSLLLFFFFWACETSAHEPPGGVVFWTGWFSVNSSPPTTTNQTNMHPHSHMVSQSSSAFCVSQLGLVCERWLISCSLLPLPALVPRAPHAPLLSRTHVCAASGCSSPLGWCGGGGASAACSAGGFSPSLLPRWTSRGRRSGNILSLSLSLSSSLLVSSHRFADGMRRLVDGSFMFL